MTRNTKPIYLLGDSRLLFTDQFSNDGFSSNDSRSKNPPVFADIPDLFISDPNEETTKDSLSAAYIGASNGDEPAFYELFCEAMNRLGIKTHYFIRSSFTTDELDKLKNAHVIMLAGGDTAIGWKAMLDRGVPDILLECYSNGAVLMGISAGAIQLGWQVFTAEPVGHIEFTDGLKLAPFLVSAHEENPEWPLLQQLVTESKSISRGIGLPYGGALVYYPDGEAEVRGNSVIEIIHKDDKIHTSFLV
ncbi:MAG: Type 1 glutamine amidotransferase-like domain-containing protein [Cyclobacteriaceae bacterium]